MSKESDLNTFADALRRFVDQEIPTAAQWNVNPDLVDAITRAIGAYFTDVEAKHAALTTLFQADHDDTTGANPPADEWVPELAPPSFVDGTSFTLPLDRTADYRVGERIRIHQGAGGTALLVVAITEAVYSAAGTPRTKLTVATAAGSPPLLSGVQALVAIDRALAIDSMRRVGGFDLVDGAVNDPRLLATGVVTGPKIAAGSVDDTKIAPGAVVYGKLGPSSVRSAELALWGPPGTGVLTAHLGDLCISAAKIGNGQVVSQHIGPNAVLWNHIKAGNIFTFHIADGNVLTQHLHDGAVISRAISAGAVQTQHIVAKNVTRDKLADLNYQNGPGVNQLWGATYEQTGWNFVTVTHPSGSDLKAQVKQVTFPVAFATTLSIVLTAIGIKAGSDPAHYNDVEGYGTGTRLVAPSVGSTPSTNFPLCMVAPGSISAAGFVALVVPASSSANWNLNDRILFFWRAVGQ